MALFRIICKSPDKTDAYAEPVTNVRPVSAELRKYLISREPVYYTDPRGHEWTCDRNDIVEDPVIDHWAFGDHCCKILLGGEKQ